ncbi:MAG TPA: DUF5677 domain-containing protein [Arthrobacter sp.]
MDAQSQRTAYAVLYSDIQGLVHTAPAPVPAPFGSGERARLSAAAAVALSWGWLIRLLRTGQAAIDLETGGYGEEASPLVRSALEHAIRLYWVAQVGAGAVEVALRERSMSINRMRESQSEGWSYTDEEIAALEELQAESSTDFRSLDTFRNLRNFVLAHPEQLKPAYQAWLLETQRSHPTLTSARPYYTLDHIRDGYVLDHEPDGVDHEIGGQVCAAALFGVSAYAEATKTAGYFEEPLGALNSRYVEIIKGSRPQQSHN